MGKETGISWTDHTFNPWRGCTKVSHGCTHCYAETLSRRNPATLGVWGPNGTRVVASESMWRQPLKWDREARAAGERRRVFCASLADVFEDWSGPMVNAGGETLHDHVFGWNAESGDSRGPLSMDDVRIRIWTTILATPNLDWLLLTKRPENVLPTLRRIKAIRERRILIDDVMGSWIDGSHPPDNVWIGTSVEDQETADRRIPDLLKIPATIRFLSMEPMMGPIDLIGMPELGCRDCGGSGISDDHFGKGECCCVGSNIIDGIHWVIVGGESGSRARPFDIRWARSIRDQCEAAGVPYFCKQWGSNPYNSAGPGNGYCAANMIELKDSHGGDWDEWYPEDRVRQFPRAMNTEKEAIR